MALASVHVDFIQVRNVITDEREEGLNVYLLPEGGTAPGDLIALTEETNLPGAYKFPGSVVNGLYDVYEGSPPAAVQHGTEQVQVWALRGVIKSTDTDFIKEW